MTVPLILPPTIRTVTTLDWSKFLAAQLGVGLSGINHADRLIGVVGLADMVLMRAALESLQLTFPKAVWQSGFVEAHRSAEIIRRRQAA